MRRGIKLEVISDPPAGTLLLQIATVLRDLQLDLEWCQWSAAPTGNLVTLRLVLRPGDSKHTAHVIEQFQKLPEMIHVTACQHGELVAAGSRPPMIMPPEATD